LRKGALNAKAKELNCTKVAYAHHQDDVVETVMMSQIFEGHYYCFPPVTYLTSSDLTVIRPLIYVTEAEIKGFKNKYPFGTVQYLIAQLESEGVKISLPDLNTPVPNSKIKIGDLLHRADDAMKTSLYAYKSNADFWWKWLDDKAPNGSIEKMKEYLEIMESSSVASVNADGIKHKKKDYEDHKKKIVEDIKEKTKNYFKEQFQCKSSDGGFNNIVDEHGIILPNIELYCKSVALLFGFKELTIPNHYVAHSGKACRTRWLDIFENDFLKDYTICGHKIFSYAFIYGPDNDGQTNFSFTIDMK
jgi:hypothetical protein